MIELPPLGRCPLRKRGHKLTSWMTMAESGDVHFGITCKRCGVTRLCGPESFDASTPLDDRLPDVIRRSQPW